MPWMATGMRREVRKEKNAAVQKGKWGCFTPQSLSNGQGKVTGGRRGSGAAVVQS